MKKLLISMVTMGLALSISGATAFAAGAARGRNFVDNDGVCDSYSISCQFVDNDGDGICDNCGLGGCGMGAGYIDADGDGICDNYAAAQNGSGFQGRRCGRGRCGR